MFWDKLLSIEKDTILTISQKKERVILIRKEFEAGNLPKDSVYARMLHRIGLYEFLLNNEVANNAAINYTIEAVRINSSGTKNSSQSFCINSYANLANFYRSLGVYDVAARYLDSAIVLRRKIYVPQISFLVMMLDKAQMLFMTGDYQNAYEELTVAIVDAGAEKDTGLLAPLLNQRAQVNIKLGRFDEAMNDIDGAALMSAKAGNNYEAITSNLLKADILAKQKRYNEVIRLYKDGINERLKMEDYIQVSDDYTDFGNFYLNELADYNKAEECYKRSIAFAAKKNDHERLAKAHTNLEQGSFRRGKYADAEKYMIAALKDLDISGGSGIFTNPPSVNLNVVGNKELLLFLFGNKTELLLQLFKQLHDTTYVTACLQTALLTDTIITKMRHEQLGEKSKLYWRNRTREFFMNTIEACYLSGNMGLAFYFMEKSRAVLLNDKLNELGASAHLPLLEKEKERYYQVAVVEAQQKLSSGLPNSNFYDSLQMQFVNAKSALEHYLRSLEKNYPAYFAYKYADKVPSLNELKRYIVASNQSFVHYFIADTVAYLLAVTASKTRLFKVSSPAFEVKLLKDFLQIIADPMELNSNYRSFLSTSYRIYKFLFHQLDIPGGKVIICPDNYLVPFEALTSDSLSAQMLIYRYAFSYVYSAGYLLKRYNSALPQIDFAGYAPVNFSKYKNVNDLVGSNDALKRSAAAYRRVQLFEGKKATSRNFINTVSSCAVANVFSHAFADTTDTEPLLLMYDSSITLSQLQLLSTPANRLVILSACETNVGKNASGEGVFSLARGFTMAGFPSVASTLWKADEKSVYVISEKFNQYLSEGMAKDDALQKAKLDFLATANREKKLPYYWAGMLLVGNVTPVEFSVRPDYSRYILYLVILVLTVVVVIRALKKRNGE